MIKVRSDLDKAREQRKFLEQKNTELEVVIQQLNESIGTLDERILAVEKEYQNREVECETAWKDRVNELTAQIKRITS
jgi:prefoldin subunit 5